MEIRSRNRKIKKWKIEIICRNRKYKNGASRNELILCFAGRSSRRPRGLAVAPEVPPSAPRSRRRLRGVAVSPEVPSPAPR